MKNRRTWYKGSEFSSWGIKSQIRKFRMEKGTKKIINHWKKSLIKRIYNVFSYLTAKAL